MIFMGEEWAASTPWQFFTGFAERRMPAAVRAGRRAEFGAHGWGAEEMPDPQDPATRDAACSTGPRSTSTGTPGCWTGTGRSSPCAGEADLQDGRLDRVEVNEDPRAGWFSVRRGGIMLAVDFSVEPVRVPSRAAELLLQWGDQADALRDDAVHLDGHDVAVVRVRDQPQL